MLCRGTYLGRRVSSCGCDSRRQLSQLLRGSLHGRLPPGDDYRAVPKHALLFNNSLVRSRLKSQPWRERLKPIMREWFKGCFPSVVSLPGRCPAGLVDDDRDVVAGLVKKKLFRGIKKGRITAQCCPHSDWNTEAETDGGLEQGFIEFGMTKMKMKKSCKNQGSVYGVNWLYKLKLV